MFERFTEPSREVLAAAQELATNLGSPYIGVGHLLYGCAVGREETAGQPLRVCGITAAYVRRLLPPTMKQSAGQVDPEALSAIGIDYEGVRVAVEGTFGAGALDNAPDRRLPATRTRRPHFTPNAKRSLELALRAARELHQDHLMPGHLLLGLLRLDNEFLSSVVEQSSTTVATVSAAVLTNLAAAA